MTTHNTIPVLAANLYHTRPELTEVRRGSEDAEFFSAGSEQGPERYDGARVLWLKVIIQAAFDWVSFRDCNNLLQRKIAESAYSWLFEHSELFNSFENICSSLGILPENIRRWANGLTMDNVGIKIEHVERGPRSTTPEVRLLAAESISLEEEGDDEEF